MNDEMHLREHSPVTLPALRGGTVTFCDVCGKPWPCPWADVDDDDPTALHDAEGDKP